MRDTKASLPPTRFPAAGNVLLTATESLNENDLSRGPLRFCQSERIYRDESGAPLCDPSQRARTRTRGYARRHI